MKLILSIAILICVLHTNVVHCKDGSLILNEDNWDQMLEGEWMVEFFAPWCPACKALQPIWKEFASWSEDLGIKVGQVDVTDSPGLSGRFIVTALPTIYHVKNGVFRQYRGPRDKEQLISFVEEKKWMELEEIPAWKNPGSYQMAVVAQFFKLSMVLREVHTSLVQDYGLPEWGSYVIFALCTIVTGALIGLILVCIIDVVFPPKPPHDVHQLAQHIPDQEEDLADERGEGSGEEETEGDVSQGEGSQDEGEAVSSQGEAGSSQDESQGEDVSQGEEERPESEQSPVTRRRRARRAD